MILGNTSHLTHTLFLFCCGDILKSHKEDFPDLDIPELQQSPSHWAPNSCHSVNGLALSILLSSLQTPFFCKGEGCKQLDCHLEWSKGNHIGRHQYHPLPSKGNHVGRHWNHPLPAWVLMSQVLLLQARTEDGERGRVLHLSVRSIQLTYITQR